MATACAGSTLHRAEAAGFAAPVQQRSRQPRPRRVGRIALADPGVPDQRQARRLPGKLQRPRHQAARRHHGRRRPGGHDRDADAVRDQLHQRFGLGADLQQVLGKAAARAHEALVLVARRDDEAVGKEGFLDQIVGLHGCERGPAMVRASDRHQAVLEQRQLAHAGTLDVAANDGKVDRALRQQVERPVLGVGHRLDLQVRQRPPCPAIELRVPGHDAEVRLADADHRADAGVRDLHGVGLGTRQVVHQPPRGQQHALAGRRQLQTLLLAQKELRIEPPLRLAQAVAEGGLGQPEQRRRLRHRGGVGNGDQHGEVPHLQSGLHGGQYDEIVSSKQRVF